MIQNILTLNKFLIIFEIIYGLQFVLIFRHNTAALIYGNCCVDYVNMCRIFKQDCVLLSLL